MTIFDGWNFLLKINTIILSFWINEETFKMRDSNGVEVSIICVLASFQFCMFQSIITNGLKPFSNMVLLWCIHFYLWAFDDLIFLDTISLVLGDVNGCSTPLPYTDNAKISV